MEKFRYTDEQKQKIQSIIRTNKNKGWEDIANAVNASNIVQKKFTSRGLFKTNWAWNKSNEKTSKPVSKPVVATSKPVKKETVRVKRPYNRKKPVQQLHVLPVPEVSNTNDSVIVLVVKANNIRSVLEQLQ